MRSLRPGIFRGLALVLLLAGAAPAAPDLAGSFSIGNSGTDQKPQSKLWFNDGAWWAVAYDGVNGQHIWKLENGTFLKQTYPDAIVDGRPTARADVLWDGTYLYVLMWHPATPMFSQYGYDPSTQQYTRLPGFPVSLPIANSTTMVFDKDSTGRLFAAFGQGPDIHVIWTTSPDHLGWNTGGMIAPVVGSGLWPAWIARVSMRSSGWRMGLLITSGLGLGNAVPLDGMLGGAHGGAQCVTSPLLCCCSPPAPSRPIRPRALTTCSSPTAFAPRPARSSRIRT